jgi:hypothetical protein
MVESVGSCWRSWELRELTLNPRPPNQLMAKLGVEKQAFAHVKMDIEGWEYSVFTLEPLPLNPATYTLHPTPYTLHPTLYTLHPKPLTLNPEL